MYVQVRFRQLIYSSLYTSSLRSVFILLMFTARPVNLSAEGKGHDSRWRGQACRQHQ